MLFQDEFDYIQFVLLRSLILSLGHGYATGKVHELSATNAHANTKEMFGTAHSLVQLHELGKLYDKQMEQTDKKVTNFLKRMTCGQG